MALEEAGFFKKIISATSENKKHIVSGFLFVLVSCYIYWLVKENNEKKEQLNEISLQLTAKKTKLTTLKVENFGLKAELKAIKRKEPQNMLFFEAADFSEKSKTAPAALGEEEFLGKPRQQWSSSSPS